MAHANDRLTQPDLGQPIGMATPEYRHGNPGKWSLGTANGRRQTGDGRRIHSGATNNPQTMPPAGIIPREQDIWLADMRSDEWDGKINNSPPRRLDLISPVGYE